MIGILYPSPRSVAYSSLFYRIIRNRLLEDRVYTGSWFLEDRQVIGETGRPPRRARALLVSLPFEVMYRDYVEMMLLAGLDPARRGSSDETIILAGGPAVTANPGPIMDLVDAVMIGEIEDIYDSIVSIMAGPGSKGHRLSLLAEVPGILVPGRSEPPVRRHYARDLDRAILTLDQRIPSGVEPVWGKSYIVEASRGCARGCRFCMEGYIFRPKRDRSLAAMRMLIEQAKPQGYGKVSFYSLSFFDNPNSEAALEYAISLGLEASVPSLRADTVNEKRLELIGMAGQKTLTIAPETGSCRICRAINKHITPDTVERIVEAAPRHGIRSIKLYLITGFPGEAEGDYDETLRLVERVASLLRSVGLRARVSLNPFMPKPVTPLQWAALPRKSVYRSRVRRLRKIAARTGNLDVSAYEYRWAEVQTVLARGGPELSRLLVEWARAGPGTGHFRRAARLSGVNTEKYLGSFEGVPYWHRLAEHPYASLELLRREYEAFLDALSGR